MGVETVESLEIQATEKYLHEAKIYIATLNPAIRVTLDETTSADIAGAILERAERHQVEPHCYPCEHQGHHCRHVHEKCSYEGSLPYQQNQCHGYARQTRQEPDREDV